MKKIIVCAALVLIAFACVFAASAQKTTKPVRVGVFDSRAVAVAFAASLYNKKELNGKIAERDTAKAAGDTKKADELERWGKERQAMMHRQGYGTASVRNLLEYIKSDLPKIAKEAGVDVIVSKWDIVFKGEAVEFMDVTDSIAKPFNPDAKTLKQIEDIKKVKPLTEEEVANLKD